MRQPTQRETRAADALPFGDLVRRYRRTASLTQEELAERAGLSARAIRENERGTKHIPRKETVQLLADSLEISSEELAGFTAAARRHRVTAPMKAGDSIQMAAPLEQAIARLSEPATVAGDETTQSVGSDQSSSAAASSPSPSKRPAARVLSAVPWLWSTCLPWTAAATGVKVLLLDTATTLGSALHSPSAAITRYQFVANWGVQGPATGTLQAPAGLALDSKGDL